MNHTRKIDYGNPSRNIVRESHEETPCGKPVRESREAKLMRGTCEGNKGHPREKCPSTKCIRELHDEKNPSGKHMSKIHEL